MKKLCVLFFAWMLCPALLLASCGRTASDTPTEGMQTVFFLDAEGDALTTESMELPQGSAEEKVTQVIERIEAGPQNKAHHTLLPSDVLMDEVTVNANTAEIDFNAAYLAMTRAQEVLARAGIVRSLVQIPEIVYVSFTVEGEPVKDSKGIEIGVMTADSFIENTGKQINTYLNTTIQLYFADETQQHFQVENRSIYYSSSMPLEWAVVERIIGGPKLSDCTATVPSTTQIVSVASADGTCYVNLNENFATDVPGVSTELKLYSIVNSLVASCGVTEVQFSINGDTNASVGDISLSQTFTAKDI